MIAAESVQPVPWVDVVSMRGWVKWRMPSGVTSTSVSHVAGEMAALDQRGGGAEPQQRLAGTLHGGRVVDHAAGEDRRLVEIGRNQRGQRQQALADDVLGFGA